MEIIAWIGFSQALFAGLIVGTKKGLTTADKILSAWLILMAIEFATYGIDEQLFEPPSTLSNPFLLFNPAMYLYSLSLTNKSYNLRWAHLWHLLPYIAFETTAFILGERLFLSDFLERDGTLWFRILFAIASFLSWAIYPILTIRTIHRHRMNLMNEFSTIESYNRISWLLSVMILYTLYWVASLSAGLYNFFAHRAGPVWALNYSILLVLTYVMGFYGLKQEKIFPPEPEEGSEKYKRSRLQKDYKERVKIRLLNYFESEKPYLDPELTIGHIAAKLKIPRHVLTEVLNSAIGKNFYQFVNEYRVEAVKEMLTDPKLKNLSIEAVGFECGFNSKSTFFSVFKSMTGMTPAQFQNSDRVTK